MRQDFENKILEQLPQIKIRKFDEYNLDQKMNSPGLIGDFQNFNGEEMDLKSYFYIQDAQNETNNDYSYEKQDLIEHPQSPYYKRQQDECGQFLIDRDSDDIQQNYGSYQVNQNQFGWIPQNQSSYYFKLYYPIPQQYNIPPQFNYQIQGQKQIQEIDEQQNETEIQKKFKQTIQNVTISQSKCSCKKSQCLKLYCDCFTNNQVCSQNCGCIDCGNRLDNQLERDKAVQDALERNLDAFINTEEIHTISVNDSNNYNKIENNINNGRNIRKGCTCKKTACQKKYCECYGQGNKCIPTCKCQNCRNTDAKNKKVKIF